MLGWASRLVSIVQPGRPGAKPGVFCRAGPVGWGQDAVPSARLLPMKPITLRIDGTDATGLPTSPLLLRPGMHAFAWDATGTLSRIDDARAASLCFCVDRRGVWLTVGDDARGVHVNGRPVQRMAMLRIGDSVHVDGAAMVLAGPSIQMPARESAVRVPGQQSQYDPRTVLRGVGGRYHGRSFTLDQPRTVGSDAACDIRIDDAAFAARHCRIGLENGALVLRALDSDDASLVNGMPVRDAVLQGGDQVVFDAHQRFVVEAPSSESVHEDALPLPEDAPPIAPADARRRALGRSARRLPWVLVAAFLIAGLLSALLLFGGAG